MDGGILLPKSLLLRIPLFKIDKVNFNKLKEVVVGQMEKEKSFLSYKKNAGVFQETVKIPASYRNELNHLLFSNVNFDIIHKNSEF